MVRVVQTDPRFATRIAVFLLLLLIGSVSGALAAETGELRRSSVPFYTQADDRQPAGEISRSDVGGKFTIAGEQGRRLKITIPGKGDVWLRAMDVKRAGETLPPCPEQIAGSGTEGTAASRGMSRGCE